MKRKETKKMERWERYVKKNQRILFSPVLFHNLPSSFFSFYFSGLCKTGLFSSQNIVDPRRRVAEGQSSGRRGMDVGRRNRVKKCDGNERKNVAKRANRGGEKKEGKEKKGRRGEERENSPRVEFPLLFDLPTHAFCFPTADVALEIKDLKHTPREGKVRGGGIVSSPVFPSRFFSPFYRPCLRRSQIVREKPRSYTFV